MIYVVSDMPIRAKNCYTKMNKKSRHPATVVLVATVKSGILRKMYKSVVDVMLTVVENEDINLNQSW